MNKPFYKGRLSINKEKSSPFVWLELLSYGLSTSNY